MSGAVASTTDAPATRSSPATASIIDAISRSPVKPTKRWRSSPMRAPLSDAASSDAANALVIWRAASAVAGSSASGPATRSSTSATSRTDFASGPTASLYGLSGITPARLVKPRVVRIVASDANAAGFESELQVSVPNATVTRLVEAATALPPLEPDVLSVGSYALPIVPATELIPKAPNGDSAKFALPRITAPAPPRPAAE